MNSNFITKGRNKLLRYQLQEKVHPRKSQTAVSYTRNGINNPMGVSHSNSSRDITIMPHNSKQQFKYKNPKPMPILILRIFKHRPKTQQVSNTRHKVATHHFKMKSINRESYTFSQTTTPKHPKQTTEQRNLINSRGYIRHEIGTQSDHQSYKKTKHKSFNYESTKGEDKIDPKIKRSKWS